MPNITLFLLSIINGFYVALIFMYLWNWFISPLGFIEINYFHSLGITLIYSIFYKSQYNKYYDEMPFTYTILIYLLQSFTFFIAWLIKDMI